METLLAFLIGVLSSLTAYLLLRYKILYTLLPSKTKKGYLVELENKIRQMPFIYKDLDTDIINDFVDVEFQSIDLGTLQLQLTNKNLIVDKDDKLKRNYKVLFLGNAGIGKTTFQRRTILTLIKDQSKSRFIYQMETPIPIYIPLKAVDNSHVLPILSYIRNSNPIFAYRFGLHKLLKLTKKRRIFLFLDGYDEIPFTGGERNFVQEELGAIFFPAVLNEWKGQEKLGIQDKIEEREFYEALTHCRVWLSSRREFFEKNPIEILRVGSNIRTVGIAAIELKGIGNNRIKLAKKIFDKYKKRSKEYYEYLDEEYFLFEIDNSDDEIKNLSYNPLFLTVMCYIYAQKAIEEKQHKVKWINKFEELILECVELLLNDLDKIKARDLPKAHRAALLTRRNPFVDEKKLFLQYFALQLYFDDKPVFTLIYLKECLRTFFEKEFALTTAETILKNLGDDDNARPNVALQLIYQGVFILVDKSKDEVLYDFPHRRFREVLASKYVSTPMRYEQLLANIEQKQFSEFLTVYFNSDGFKDLHFQEESLNYILERSIGHVADNHYVQITSNFIRRKPISYIPDKSIGRFLANALHAGQCFRLSLELLRNFAPGHDFIKNLQEVMKESVNEQKLNQLSLTLSLLSFYNPYLLIEFLKPKVLTHKSNRNLLPIIFQYLWRTEPTNTYQYIQDIYDDEEAYFDFCYAFCFNLSLDIQSSSISEAPLEELKNRLDRRMLLILFYFIFKYCMTKYQFLKERFQFDIKAELFDYANNIKSKQVVDDVFVGQVGILTQKTIDEINYWLDERRIAFIMNKAFIAKDKDGNNVRETLFAAIPISKSFRIKLNEELMVIVNKISKRDNFESFLSHTVKDLSSQLTLNEPSYQRFNQLPEAIRALEIQYRDQYTRKKFEDDLLDLLKRNSIYEYSIIKEVRDLVDDIDYTPPPLIEFFQ